MLITFFLRPTWTTYLLVMVYNVDYILLRPTWMTSLAVTVLLRPPWTTSAVWTRMLGASGAPD